MHGLFDEVDWPKVLSLVEVEERRRLFWSMCTLEVYSSIVFSGMIRLRELQSRVVLPSQVHDELFSDSGFEGPVGGAEGTPRTLMNPESSWMHGWNFTIELYRTLEHAMNDFHRCRPLTLGPFSPASHFSRETPSRSAVLDKVTAMHADLPLRFKETKSVTWNMAEDILKNPAALQLVRMVLFTGEDATAEQSFAIAKELLEEFGKVPVFFLRAISSPLLHHLAGIGSITGSMIEDSVSESSYLQVRRVLFDPADLLASLDISITRTVGAAQRIRNHIYRIDEFMIMQRQQDAMLSNGVQFSITAAPTRPLANASGGLDEDLPQSPMQWQGQPSETYNYIDWVGIDQFYIQLPQELLEGWPWHFDPSSPQVSASSSIERYPVDISWDETSKENNLRLI